MSDIKRLLSAFCATFIMCVLTLCDGCLAESSQGVKVEYIMLSRYDIELAEKNKLFIAATIYPSNADIKMLEWTVDDETVASIVSVTSQGAWIQAKGAAGNETSVTAKATDGSGVFAKCDIRITAPVSDILLWSDSQTGIILVGDTLRVYSSILPADATDELKWTSDDESVATITKTYPDGVMILARNGGEARITAQAQDGTGCSKFYTVFVRVPIESMSLPDTARVFIGETLQLKPTLSPPNTTDTTIRWRSEDGDIATVSGAGLVTAINEGTTRVIARSAANASVSGICELSVTRPVLVINLTTAYPVIGKGGSTQVLAAIAPYNATLKNISWATNDENIASINTSGVVTGKSPGTVIVSATALDGSGVVGLLPIEVRNSLEGISLPPELSLYPGESNSPKLTVTPHDLDIGKVSWMSTNSEAVTVNQDGVITGLAIGESIVIATAPNGMIATCTVTVSKAITDVRVYIRGAEMTEGSVYNLDKNAEVTMKASVQPASSESYITWSSSKKGVVELTGNGVARAISPGVTVITASAMDYKTHKLITSKSFKIKVVIPVTSVVMPGHIDILTGQEKKITATVKPYGADNKTLSWTSGNTGVVKVTGGVITGCEPGEALVLATTKNLITGVTRVTVYRPVSEINLSLPEGRTRVWAGDTFKLEKSVSPLEAGNAVTWRSSDKKIATVDPDGKVAARKRGNVTITAVAKDGSGVKGSIKLTVEDTVTDVSFKTAVVELFCNTFEEGFRTQTLKPVVRPSTATGYDVGWEVNDTSVATVNESGQVTAQGEGACTVTATVDGVSASIIIKVRRLPSFISLDIDEMSLEVGDKVSVATDVSFDGSDSYIVWKSSRKRVATINENGLIKARKPGNTIISVQTRNGLKASFKLSVRK